MTDAPGEPLPLVQRFPALATVPRVALADLPTPVEHVPALGTDLWLKRDDLTSPAIGGSKVRALEFLLARVPRGGRVVTVGATGSTHELTTVLHAARLGITTHCVRWRQDMNAAAARVGERLATEAAACSDVRTVPGGYASAWVQRLRGAHWIPAGGTSALGMLGHVNAVLELAAQVRAGALPEPARIVLPLGSGGTTAGLLAGLSIAGLHTRVEAVRVVPRILGNRGHVLRLAWSVVRLLRRLTGERVPYAASSRLDVVHAAYGGAYGRETAGARDAAARYASATGRTIDTTYGAKALSVALGRHGGGPTVFWVTFDGRWLG